MATEKGVLMHRLDLHCAHVATVTGVALLQRVRQTSRAYWHAETSPRQAPPDSIVVTTCHATAEGKAARVALAQKQRGQSPGAASPASGHGVCVAPGSIAISLQEQGCQQGIMALHLIPCVHAIIHICSHSRAAGHPVPCRQQVPCTQLWRT